MLFRLTSFAGEIPRQDATLLPKGAAQRAENCDFASGALRSMHGPNDVHTEIGAVEDFIAYDGEFLTFTTSTHYAPGPVADDRLYVTSQGAPPNLVKMPAKTFDTLALPTPTAAPLIAIDTEPTDDPENPLPVETVVFATTWVTDLDEETPPSPLSNALDVKEGATVSVSILDATPPVGSRINRIRVYRSATSATGTTGLYFIKELSAGTALMVHDLDADPLQELIPSIDYDPPVSTLQGITPMQNGMIAAFSGRSLYFCEPFMPHAWPQKYELKTDYDIVGLAASGNFLAILTTGTPYIAQGSAPENILLERLDLNLPCVSAGGIVDVGQGVVYPSHDGLVLMSGPTAQIISRELFDRRTWRALGPGTIQAGHYDGRYVFTHDSDGERATSMVDLNGEVPGFVRTNIEATGFSYDLVTGRLFYSDGTAELREFASLDAAALPIEWVSGILHLPVPQHFGVVKVEGEQIAGGAAFSMGVYADGVLNATCSSLNAIERLAPGLAQKWHVEVSGAVKITRISLAGDPSELMGV